MIKDLKDFAIEVYGYFKPSVETVEAVTEVASEAVQVTGDVGREFNFDWWDFITKLIVVTLLWLLWREYLKQKDIMLVLVDKINESGEHWYQQINNVASEITNNLNESNRMHEVQIGYVDFYHQHKDKDHTEFVKLLRKQFSIEDLQDAGVPVKFLNKVKDKLMPREFFDKFKELRYEYIEYKMGARDIGAELDKLLDKAK